MSPLFIMIESVGILAFSLSGALSAARKDMDIFGFAVLALMPAVGGGTLRDLVLDVPVFWVEDTRPIWITGVGVLAVYFGENFLNSRRKVIVWADAVGLALFAVAGAQKAYLETGDPLISVMMGVATAVAGGIIRDIIANEIPLILQQEVYATAAFCGAFVYMALTLVGFDFIWAAGFGFAAGFMVRALAIWFGWSLPKRKTSRPNS
ncbi:membrane protein [Iodidimonas gelatinilytica]|uniref:Membrane protein n=1 Tax=Iodidimonas gelatinilytica TaxID=1236966 RepID=A0A5A7N0J9_9PROT|nr:trimeric intracellular cation channel family protein [Iodidimonas gelatinilytica]GER01215.1 membrane protein [Iodidimonas gelatinilytica]